MSLSQDTTVIQTFTFEAQDNPATAYDSPGRRWFQFPPSNNGIQYQKILMLHKLKCFSNGTAGGLGFPCGEWDYLTYNYLFEHTGLLDSIALSHPHYLLNNTNFTEASFSFFPTYQQQQVHQISSNYIANNDQLLNLGLSNNPITGPLTNSSSQRTQYLITASELTSMGLVPGNIGRIQFPMSQYNALYQNATLSLGLTSQNTLSSFINNGLTPVYLLNTASNAVNDFIFSAPFFWDGSNLIIDFYYPSALFTGNNIVLGDQAPTNTAIASQNDRFIRFDWNDKVEVPAAAFDSIENEITIAFWLRGDAALQPESGTCFEGRNANNQRVLNAHLPWGNSRVYWDAGYNGGYNRIDKAAVESEYEGNWNHWAFTKNAATGEMKIFLNGSLWHSGTNLTNTMTDIVQFTIGSACTWSNFYHGDIDDFQIFNTALDANTIQQWMYQLPNSNHPFYDRLQLLYTFDETGGSIIDHSPFHHDGFISGDAQLLLHAPSEIFKNYIALQERPAFTFFTGDFTLLSDTVVNTIITENTPQYLTQYFIENHQVYIESAMAVYPQLYSYTTDINGEITDSTLNTLESLTNDTLHYFSAPFDEINRYEIGRYITPYGINLDLGDGWTWVFDVTDFAPLLRDSVQLEAGNWQELLDLKFLFIEGTPSREVKRIENVWNGNWGLAGFDNNVTQKTLQMQPGEAGVKLRATVTGHGFGSDANNCGEFCYNTHSLKVNGNPQFQWEIMEECDQNPLYPQGGTWIYARAGWCPGKEGRTQQFELTPFLQNNQVQVDYDITYDPYGNYVTESQAIFYGPHLLQIDPALDWIMAPNEDNMQSRWNPVCDEARIVIHNKGQQTLTSLEIQYGLPGNMESFQWTGNLAFDEKEEVYLPVTNNNFWNTAPANRNQFDVLLIHPNDQNTTNNAGHSYFHAPPIYTYAPAADNNKIIIYLKTNLANTETTYKLYDINDNVVYQRTVFPQTNFVYKDTVTLNAGCYKFHLLDSDGDGQNFFANNDGNGYCKFDRVSGADFIQFERDFGQDIVHYFRFETNIVSVQETLNSAASVTVYPNPVHDELRLRVNGLAGKNTVLVYDMTGHLVHIEPNVSFQKEDQWRWHHALSSGMYSVVIQNNQQIVAQHFIVP